MKVIILAGGWGTRLGRHSENIPKPMVPIGDKPILWHIMKIYSSYGFNDFIISLGVKSNVIKDYFLNYDINTNDFSINLENGKITKHNASHQTNWNVTLVDTGLNTLKGARIKRVEKYLDSEINMVTYGDGVADVNLDELLRFHKSHGKVVTITGVHPPARFGELIEEDGRVTNFEEKPQSSVGLINGGFMIFNKELLTYLNESENCDFESGPLESLVAKDQVMVYKHLGNWECVDNERDLNHLNELWTNDNAFWKRW